MTITGDYFLMVMVGLAGFLTWFASKRRDILVCMISGLVWFALAMWLFFSPTPPLDLANDYVKILAWVFIVLTFIPAILYMNQEIRHERGGRSWTTYGNPPPEETESNYERHRRELRARLGRQRRRRLL